MKIKHFKKILGFTLVSTTMLTTLLTVTACAKNNANQNYQNNHGSELPNPENQTTPPNNLPDKYPPVEDNLNPPPDVPPIEDSNPPSNSSIAMDELLDYINKKFSFKDIYVDSFNAMEIPNNINTQYLITNLKNATSTLAIKLYECIKTYQSEFNITSSLVTSDHRNGMIGITLALNDSKTIEYSSTINLTGFKNLDLPTSSPSELIKQINTDTKITLINEDIIKQSYTTTELIDLLKNNATSKLGQILSDKKNITYYDFILENTTKSFSNGDASYYLTIKDNTRQIKAVSSEITLSGFTKNTSTNTSLKALDIKNYIESLKTKQNADFFSVVNYGAWEYASNITSFNQLKNYLQDQFNFVYNNHFNLAFEKINSYSDTSGTLDVDIKITNQYNLADIQTVQNLVFTNFRIKTSATSATEVANRISNLPSDALAVDVNGKTKYNSDYVADFYNIQEILTNKFSRVIPNDYELEFSRDNGIVSIEDTKLKGEIVVRHKTDISDSAISNTVTFNSFAVGQINRHPSYQLKETMQQLNNLSFGSELQNDQNTVSNSSNLVTNYGFDLSSVASNKYNFEIVTYDDLYQLLDNNTKKILEPYNVQLASTVDTSVANRVSVFLKLSDKTDIKNTDVTGRLTFFGFKNYRDILAPIKNDPNNKVSTQVFKGSSNTTAKEFYDELIKLNSDQILDKLFDYIQLETKDKSKKTLTKNDLFINSNNIGVKDSNTITFGVGLSEVGALKYSLTSSHNLDSSKYREEQNIVPFKITGFNQATFVDKSPQAVATAINDQIDLSYVLLRSSDDIVYNLTTTKFDTIFPYFKTETKDLFTQIKKSNFTLSLVHKRYNKWDSKLVADLKIQKNGTHDILTINDINFYGFSSVNSQQKPELDFTNNLKVDASEQDKQLTALQFQQLFTKESDDKGPDWDNFNIQYLNDSYVKELLLPYIQQAIPNYSQIVKDHNIVLTVDDITIHNSYLSENELVGMKNSFGFWYKLSLEGRRKFKYKTTLNLTSKSESKVDIDSKGFYLEINNFTDIYENNSQFLLTAQKAEALAIQTGGYIKSTDLKNYKYIDQFAFKSNDILKSIELPDSITNVGEQAFALTPNLKNATLNNNLKWLPDKMFYLSENLIDVNLPSETVSIGTSAFEAYLFSDWENFTDHKGPKLDRDIVLPSNLKWINEKAFGFTKVRSVKANDKLLYVGYGAFVSAANITNIELSPSVKRIENCAFQDNLRLTSIKFGGNEQFLGAYTFLNSRLTSVDIPDTVSEISGGTFANCLSLSNINLGNSIHKIETDAFSNTLSLLSLKLPDSTYFVGTGAFYGSKIAEIDLNKVNIIGVQAFEGTNITDLVIPHTVQHINERAFANLKLKSLTFASTIDNNGEYWANRVDYIGEQAFIDSLYFSKLYLPFNIFQLYGRAFAGNEHVESIVIPKSLKFSKYGIVAIGDYLFDGMDKLTQIKIPYIYKNSIITSGLTYDQQKMIDWY